MSVYSHIRSPDTTIRPIIIFGAVLMLLALLSAGVFLFRPGSPVYFLRLYQEGFYFPLSLLVGLHMFYLLTGVGVVSLARWGYYLFKFFLYLHLFIAFPIGTIISYFTLSYMRKHQISRYFGLAAHGESPEPRPLAFSSKVILLIIGIGLVALYLWMMTAFF